MDRKSINVVFIITSVISTLGFVLLFISLQRNLVDLQNDIVILQSEVKDYRENSVVGNSEQEELRHLVEKVLLLTNTYDLNRIFEQMYSGSEYELPVRELDYQEWDNKLWLGYSWEQTVSNSDTNELLNYLTEFFASQDFNSVNCGLSHAGPCSPITGSFSEYYWNSHIMCSLLSVSDDMDNYENSDFTVSVFCSDLGLLTQPWLEIEGGN